MRLDVIIRSRRNGRILAMGAYLHDGDGEDSGRTYVYQYTGSAWQQLGQYLDGETAGNRFGSLVAISSDGSRSASGAHHGGAAGHVSGVRISTLKMRRCKKDALTRQKYAGKIKSQILCKGVRDAIEYTLDLKKKLHCPFFPPKQPKAR